MTFIEEAQAKFAELITSELARIEAMKQAGEAKDFSQMERIVVGIRPGAHLRAEGMVVAGRPRPTIYNPSYEILAPGD